MNIWRWFILIGLIGILCSKMGMLVIRSARPIQQKLADPSYYAIVSNCNQFAVKDRDGYVWNQGRTFQSSNDAQSWINWHLEIDTNKVTDVSNWKVIKP